VTDTVIGIYLSRIYVRPLYWFEGTPKCSVYRDVSTFARHECRLCARGVDLFRRKLVKNRCAHKGMTLKDALRMARSLGASIDYPHATGEVRVTFSDGSRVRINHRRKDASARLTCKMRQLMTP
jgi:hypothetical protein